MKKTTFLRIFTLSLALILMLSLGLTACSDCSGCSPDTDTPPTTPGDDSASANEEEIFQTVKTAYQNSCAFEGEYLIEFLEKEVWGNESELFSTKEYINTATGESASVCYKNGEKYENSEEKCFYLNGQALIYSADGYMPLQKATRENLQEKNVGNLLSMAQHTIPGQPFAAESLEQLKNAYATVWTAEGRNAEETSVSATTADGKHTLCITVQLEMDGTLTTVKSTVEATDGKITSVLFSLSGNFDGIDAKEECGCSITYNTGKELFDSIEVSVPSDMNEIPSSQDYELDFDLVYENGTAFARVITWGQKGEIACQIIEADFYDQGGLLASAWYKDAACTERFYPGSATVQEWESLKALYTNSNALLSTGSLLVIKRVKTMTYLPDAYTIVFGASRNREDFINHQVITELTVTPEECDRVLLNGEDITEKITDWNEPLHLPVADENTLYILEFVTDMDIDLEKDFANNVT